MTAEQIRKSLGQYEQSVTMLLNEKSGGSPRALEISAIIAIPNFLGEIAAQLAELNENLKAYTQPNRSVNCDKNGFPL